MNFQRLELGAYCANGYVFSVGNGRAIVVDPGAEAPRIVEALKRNNGSLSAILLTHGHADHISAIADLLAAFPEATIYLSPLDASWCFTDANDFPPYVVPKTVPATCRGISDGDVLDFPDVSVTVLSTPGHSPGSVCFLVREKTSGEEVLFSGDTLFRMSIGRTDFEGGDNAAMANSLRRLATLDSALRVFPGHGPSTTIGAETKTNPYLLEVLS